MKVVITGASGFIGRNLLSRIGSINDIIPIPCNKTTNNSELKKILSKAQFVVHLAAVHRPIDDNEYDVVNNGLTESIINNLKNTGNCCPILYSSSVQAQDNTRYGHSKLNAENRLIEYSLQAGATVGIYRFTNIFGKWATPNHHSVVATFCYNISRDIPIKINNPLHIMKLCYIDDVIDSIITSIYSIYNLKNQVEYLDLPSSCLYSISLSELAEYLYGFRKGDYSIKANDLDYMLKTRLLMTYLSYLS